MNLQRLRLLRATARVTRMHAQPTLYRQSVGEHTFGVLAILLTVYPEASAELMQAVLYHDATEALLGDVPSPSKWRYPDVELALKAAEADITFRYGLASVISDNEKKLLKFCDIMELVFYAIEEAADGHTKMLRVAERALDGIQKRELEKLNMATYELYHYTRGVFNGGKHAENPTHDWPDNGQ